jgi:ABC-type uncharacterized transport system permease subunit
MAAAKALDIKIQITHAMAFGHRIPSELASLLPYVLTLVVLVIYGKARKPPNALGKL